jgi:hypothetical protein
MERKVRENLVKLAFNSRWKALFIFIIFHGEREKKGNEMKEVEKI